MKEIQALDGEVLAVSVDSPGQNRKVTRRYEFTFPLLSDPDLAVTDRYGLRHENGGLGGDVARPAVFVLNREGSIVWRQLTDNWRVRARPEVLLQELADIP